MRRVFVDSGGFFALLAAEDRFHDHARSLFSRANEERWRLATTNAVVVETYSLDALEVFVDPLRVAVERALAAEA